MAGTWLDTLYDVGETLYKGAKLARSLSGGAVDRSIDPLQHGWRRPYAQVREARKIETSDAPKDAYLDTQGDAGEIGVPFEGKTAFSSTLTSILAKLKGFTTKL